MSNIRRGSIAKGSLRRSACDRLEKHLSSHRGNHVEMEEDKFKSHNKVQMEHLNYLKEMCK